MAARDRAALVGSSDYRRLRNLSSHLVRRDKVNSARKFISGSVSSSGNSAARLWKLANTVLGRVPSLLPCKLVDEAGSLVTDKVELANMMNNYFISKIKKLRKGFSEQDATPITDAVDPGLLDLTDGFALTPPSPSEVTKAILGLNETNATGLDGIPVSVLKLAAPIIALPVDHMLSLSFAKGCVPMAFKTSIVTPIHKGKGKPISSPSSYRPVAILPALSKVMEKIVLQQLSPYLESKLPACQFGFRPGRNTLAAIATAHGAWAKATSAGLVTGVAAFDLTAAFDTIDHDLLCQKLSVLKIGPREVRWFKDYLNGRSQMVKYDGLLSLPSAVKFGVPQGSLLGPVLFLILIHDLPFAMNIDPVPSPTSGIVGYADDVLIWFSGPSMETVKPALESTAKTVVDYMAANFMALNPDKTQILWMGSGSNSPRVNIGDISVAPVETIEVLGLKFTRRLKSDPYILALTSAMATIVGIARRLMIHLPLIVLLEWLRLSWLVRLATVLQQPFSHDSLMMIQNRPTLLNSKPGSTMLPELFEVPTELALLQYWTFSRLLTCHPSTGYP